MHSDLLDHIFIIYGVSWYILLIVFGLYGINSNHNVIAFTKLRKYSQAGFRAEVDSGRDNICFEDQ